MYRPVLALVFIFGLLAAAPSPASADDGCTRDYYGRIVCLPGASPGVPYYGPRYGYHPRRGRFGDGDTDGCTRNYYGEIVCLPGARPGVPYYGRRY